MGSVSVRYHRSTCRGGPGTCQSGKYFQWIVWGGGAIWGKGVKTTSVMFTNFMKGKRRLASQTKTDYFNLKTLTCYCISFLPICNQEEKKICKMDLNERVSNGVKKLCYHVRDIICVNMNFPDCISFSRRHLSRLYQFFKATSISFSGRYLSPP